MTKVITSRAGPRAITKTGADGRVKVLRGENTLEAARQAARAGTAAALANAYANSDTDADIPGAAPGERGAKYWAGEAQDVLDEVQPVVDSLPEILDVPALASQVAADRVQTGADRTATSNSLAQAQAIAFASAIDAKGNVVIGDDATGPADVSGNHDGNAVNLGTGAGVGQGQLYTRKPVSIGVSCGINMRGYAPVMGGAWTGARAVSDYATFVGTHAGQDTNQNGRVLPGYGTRATGSIPFAVAPNDGEFYTINGVVLTARTAPSTAYEFARGATATEAARNLLRCLLGLTDAGILAAFYRLDDTTQTSVLVASTSRGTIGNSFTLVATGATITVSGATLTGGTNYANSGLPTSYAGDTAVGFGALAGASRQTTRRAILRATMPSVPTEGAFWRAGFGLTKTITYKATPTTALDVQIGATIAETLANTVAVLNSSTDTVIDDVTYWAQNGVLFFEHDSNNNNNFEVRSYTAALVFPAPNLWGGLSNIGANAAFGHNSLLQSTVSGSFAAGPQSGAFSTGANRVTFGAAGATSNGRDWFVVGESSLNYCDGDDVIGIGRGISAGAQDAWLAIASVSTDGVITLAAPHGYREGHQYAAAWRDRATSGAVIQRAPVGSATWATISTALAGITFQVINALQFRIIESLPNADTGERNFDYRATGTVTNLDIARFTRNVSRSATFGTSATARANTFTFGSSLYREGAQCDAIGLFVAAGELRTPSVTVSGTWPTGSILFAAANGNFADGETVTLNGTVFTAKTDANMAAANTSLIRWFRIGVDMWASLNNLMDCIRNSDDQSAAARLVNQGRFWISATSGSGWRLHFQAYDTAGASYTLATSKTGATVTAPTGTVSGISNASSANPPKDRGIVTFSTSPLRNANPGLAIYNLVTDSWRLI
jgi:hypothetical protein